MLQSEFNDWLDHHTDLFTRIRRQLGRMDPGEKERTLGAWFRLLRPVNVLDAKAASENMFAAEKVPYFDAHPAAVKRLSSVEWQKRKKSDLQARYARVGQQTNKCQYCRDSGWVLVKFAGRQLADLEESGNDVAVRRGGAAVCFCPTGQEVSAGWKSKESRSITRFHPDTHDPVLGHPSACVDAQAGGLESPAGDPQTSEVPF